MRARVVAGSLLALACAGALEARATQHPPVLIDAPGKWTLQRLGYGDHVFPLRTPEREKVGPVLYRLPADARQGPRRWHLIHLHFRIRFKAGAEGRAYVGAGTNGYAAAQIVFEVTPERIRWSEVGIVHGSVRRETSEREAEVRFVNYLQLRGVVPGLNALSFDVEQLGPPTVESLVVYADSAIEVTRRSPGSVKLSLAAPRRVALRTPFLVRYRLTNTGGQTSRRVGVQAVPEGRGVAVIGSARRSHGTLAPGAARRGSFRLRALRRGRWHVFFGGTSTTNRPGALLRIRCARLCTVALVPPIVLPPPPPGPP